MTESRNTNFSRKQMYRFEKKNLQNTTYKLVTTDKFENYRYRL